MRGEDVEHAGRAPQTEVCECTAIDEFEACVLMQREVFGLPGIDIAPRPTL